MLRALLLSVALALPVLIWAPDIAAADVTVTYVAPEKFRDREFRQERTRDSALAEFDREFAKLAERYLLAGQDLAVEVLDIDLAGEFEPWNFDYRDVRIMRDTTPPRIRLRYTLTEGGKVLKQDEVRLSDMNYFSRPGAANDIERFAHDKQLLEDWFRRAFDVGPAAQLPDLSGS
ncbi:DUF3016 domain-containing protein [Paracoccus sp. (in: a-proteobacteria)]|uniref:DUF3016 domain-containing protein n=1 Tax=Paracoccus sp. TaxID=267 RepID=UPI0028A87471|nr:DUF3016 domain-containing protein [Paracoccus sp. (in: a-proteobacteria)]